MTPSYRVYYIVGAVALASSLAAFVAILGLHRSPLAFACVVPALAFAIMAPRVRFGGWLLISSIAMCSALPFLAKGREGGFSLATLPIAVALAGGWEIMEFCRRLRKRLHQSELGRGWVGAYVGLHVRRLAATLAIGTASLTCLALSMNAILGGYGTARFNESLEASRFSATWAIAALVVTLGCSMLIGGRRRTTPSNTGPAAPNTLHREA